MRLPTPTSLPAPPRPRAEAGFTLIEMIIVSVLLLVVMSMIMTFLLDVVSREQEGVVSKRATERSMVALDQLGQDLRSTISDDRARGGGLGLDDLDFVTTGALPAVDRAGYVNQMLDVVAISEWKVQMRVPSGRGTACVTYETSAAARGRLMRYVAPSCPATAANSTSTSMVVDRVPVGAAVVAPFSYSRYDAACRPVAVSPTPSIDAIAGTGDIALLNRLASIKVDLRSYAHLGRNGASSKVQTEYVFRSRMSAPYQRALGGGCAG